MDWNIALTTAKTQVSNKAIEESWIQQLYQYAICTSLGLIGGATGTAFAIGLAIIIQALLAPDTPFWPNVLLLALAATLLGWLASWLLGIIAYWTIPSFAKCEPVKYRLHVSLIAGGLVSLVQTFLFMAVL